MARPANTPLARTRWVEASLGAWYDRAARDLPWRRSRDPWAILLSEVMLQQTRVETVIPYYQRMLSRFPDAPSMAAAPLDDVLHLWSGLGYYRRARSLWHCAREVTAHHGGQLPSDVVALRALPGIGAYTAGAVASIAFDVPAPLVDGNVQRVLSRLSGIDEDLRSPVGQRAVWAEAAALVPASRPGRFNQALMELGATVCTPRAPACAVCPLERRCVARAEGRVDELPRVSPKRPPLAVTLTAAVLRDERGRPLLARRPAEGLFGGLWEPPTVPSGELVEIGRQLRREGLLARGARLRDCGQIVHVLTHRTLTVRVLEGRAPEAASRSAPPTPYEALAFDDGGDRGLSTLARKILGAVPPRGGAR